MEYIFILGRTGKLCLAELKAVLNRKKISYQSSFESDEILHIKTNKDILADNLMSILGGTIKITEVVDKTEQGIDKDRLIEKISSIINQVKKDFGISLYGYFLNGPEFKKFVSQIKKNIKMQFGLSLNYVLPQAGMSLSSVVVSKRKLNEINIIEENSNLIIAKTLVVQNFQDWSLRDYGRPKVMPEKGMLPPKVARMMINLGLSDIPASPAGGRNPISEIRLFDPFCGVGTILAEALIIGCQVIGSDNDQKSVMASQENLEWLTKQFKIYNFKFQIFCSDAAHVSEKAEKESIDLIATEPYLGPLVETKSGQLLTKNNQKITKETLRNIIIGLEKLYIGALKDWLKILKTNGKVVIIIPSFKINNQEFFVKKPLDICENLGYTLVAGPYCYCRPQAVVIRNIYILKKITIMSS